MTHHPSPSTGARAATRSAMSVVGFLCLIAVAAHPQAPSQPSTDSARLQGAWTMVSGAADGYPLPAEYVRQMKRVFTGRDVTVTLAGQLFLSATVSLDTTRSPRTIDYHMTGGPTAGAVQLGIYAFSGDTARFCFAAPNGTRPTEFATVAGDGRTLSIWIRPRP